MTRWKKADKKTPETDRRVFAATETDVFSASYANGKWLNGTIPVNGVLHWMEIPKPPKDFAYWRRAIVSWWNKQTQRIEQTTYEWTGWAPRNAQLDRKVVFFRNPSNGQVMTGGPEHVRTPHGFERIVCSSVFEAEHWSGKQRSWDAGVHGRKMEERERIEGWYRDEIRKDILHRMATARNAINRDVLARHLEVYDKKPAPWKYERESYLHAEGHEQGH